MDINFWRITKTDVVIDEAKIIDWCNKHSLSDVQLERSVIGFFKLLGVVFMILTVFGSLFYYAEGFVLNEKLWFFGSLVIYVISASGFYSVLQSGAPFIGNSRGKIDLIMASSRNQYGIEGFIVMAAMFLIGFSLIIFSKILKTKFDSTLTKFAILFVLLQTAITTLSWLEETFKGKNFYNISFFPPAYYIKGDFFTKDQGNIQ